MHTSFRAIHNFWHQHGLMNSVLCDSSIGTVVSFKEIPEDLSRRVTTNSNPVIPQSTALIQPPSCKCRQSRSVQRLVKSRGAGLLSPCVPSPGAPV